MRQDLREQLAEKNLERRELTAGTEACHAKQMRLLQAEQQRPAKRGRQRAAHPGIRGSSSTCTSGRRVDWIRRVVLLDKHLGSILWLVDVLCLPASWVAI